MFFEVFFHAMEKISGCLGYLGGYTTQLQGDYSFDKPIQGSLLANQYDRMQPVFLSPLFVNTSNERLALCNWQWYDSWESKVPPPCHPPQEIRPY